MKMTKKYELAEKIFKSGKILKVGSTGNTTYFVCRGSNGRIYDINWIKGKGYSCSCKNIRTDTCKHIEAAKLVIQNDTEDVFLQQFESIKQGID